MKEIDNSIYETILESTMAGYWDWHIQENTEYLSPTFKRMFGYEDHEIENTPEAWQKIIHPDDLKSVLKSYEDHVKSKGKIPYDNRVRYYHKNGSIVWVYCRGKVIEWAENGEPVRMVGSHVDITQEISLREQLRQKDMESLFKKAIESAPLSMIMINKHGKIILANNETTKLFGYKFEELYNEKLEILLPNRFRKKHPSQRNTFFKEPLARRMGEGRDLYGLHKDGYEFPVEIGLNPVQTDNETYVLSAIVDISERKKLENEKDEYLQKLSESNKDLEQFAYVISHDLQEPVRTIAGFSEIIRKEIPESENPRLKTALKFVKDAVKKMSKQIDDILNYSRLNRDVNMNEKVDLNELFIDIQKQLYTKIHSKDAEIIFKTDLPKINGNHSLLNQLFLNLISNSLKFCENKPLIEISSANENNYSIIKISDNGIGIDNKYSNKIFDVFQRLHQDHEYEGNGIGLTICKKVVDLHRGEIWFNSEGQGTEFNIKLKKEDMNESN